MASSTSLALRRLLSSAAVRPGVTSRLLSTNAAAMSYEEGDEGGVDRIIHRSNRPVSPRGGGMFSDSFDPFTSRRSFLNHRLNFKDQLGETPTRWDAKETDDALHLWFDMPGLRREDVKVALEQNTVLVIKGEGDEEEGGRKFSMRRGLPENVYKTDEIKAEMKNGVLKLVVPKMKEDERGNVRHIHVD